MDRRTAPRSARLDRRASNVGVGTQARESTKALEPREKGCFGEGFPSTSLGTSSRTRRVNLRLPPPPPFTAKNWGYVAVEFSSCDLVIPEHAPRPLMFFTPEQARLIIDSAPQPGKSLDVIAALCGRLSL